MKYNLDKYEIMKCVYCGKLKLRKIADSSMGRIAKNTIKRGRITCSGSCSKNYYKLQPFLKLKAKMKNRLTKEDFQISKKEVLLIN